MTVGVCKLRGVTPEIVTVLHASGIYDAGQLLAATGQLHARAQLAARLNLDAETMLEFARCADLMRIPGLNAQHVDLLMLVGVDTVTELRRRIPENLYVRLLAVAARKKLQPIPTLDNVRGWVSQAKQLARAVYY
jgi:hypothetical protein